MKGIIYMGLVDADCHRMSAWFNEADSGNSESSLSILSRREARKLIRWWRTVMLVQHTVMGNIGMYNLRAGVQISSYLISKSIVDIKHWLGDVCWWFQPLAFKLAQYFHEEFGGSSTVYLLTLSSRCWLQCSMNIPWVVKVICLNLYFRSQHRGLILSILKKYFLHSKLKTLKVLNILISLTMAVFPRWDWNLFNLVCVFVTEVYTLQGSLFNGETS